MYPHPPFHVYFTKQQQKSSYYLGSAYLVHPGEWYENCQMATPLLLDFGLDIHSVFWGLRDYFNSIEMVPKRKCILLT